MTKLIVHPLEMIDVEHHEADRPTVPFEAPEFALDQMQKMPSVEEPGQFVGYGEAPKFVSRVA